MAECCRYLWTAFSRKRRYDVSQIQETQLKRCLGVVDLTALGVGSTLGAGVYVITAQVAKNQAGPAVLLSFLIAAVASLLSGLCYAEFAARVPRAGSAYTYSYVTVGEFLAFVIGWNMILENIIGAASVGRAWSQYLDSTINDTIRRSVELNVGSLQVPGLAEYPDFLALSLLIIATVVISVGVKISSVVSFVFTVLNLVVIGSILCIGFFHVDGKNWTNPPGFFPFGFKGVLSGAATCFYAFVGFDTIATSGEEAKKPSKNIPSAILATLIVCFVVYFGVSAVMTLMIPWNELADSAALPKLFKQVGVTGADYVIAVGGMCGLIASMMGSLFPLPRLIYSMGSDGIIFRCLGNVSPRTNTPILATMSSGLLAAVLALLMDLKSLVEMMSIGTLMAYTLVSVSVLVLRYQKSHVGLAQIDIHEDLDAFLPDASLKSVGNGGVSGRSEPAPDEDTGLLRVGDRVSLIDYAPSKETTVFKRVPPPQDPDSGSSTPTGAKDMVEEIRSRREEELLGRMARMMADRKTDSGPPGSTYQRIDSDYSISSIANLFNFGEDSTDEPTDHTHSVTVISVVIIAIVWTALCVLTIYGDVYIITAEWWAVALLVVFALTALIFIVVIARQPRNKTRLNFKVPFVPLIPLASMLINIYLLVTLTTTTWIRFAVWMGIGFLVYFGYGMWHSTERRGEDDELILYDVSDQLGIVSDSRGYR